MSCDTYLVESPSSPCPGEYSGAIHVSGANSSVYVNNSTFKKNITIIESGGAVYSYGQYANVILLSFKLPHAVLPMDPQYELGMATAVLAEPAKYCTEQSCIQVHTSSDTEVQIIWLEWAETTAL